MNQALNDFVFYSKYAKYNPKSQRKENFEETIERVFNMHFDHLSSNYAHVFDNAKFSDTYLQALEACKKGLVYGSQRALQFGGDKILTKHTRLYNCSYSYCNRPEFFGELLWILLCGCGVGYSVHTEHVNMLPSLVEPDCNESYIIEDSIEGWANAIHKLINAFMKGHCMPIFDYSLIRPKGAMISGGFIAPGPDGLRKSIEAITIVLKKAIGRKLEDIECFSIACHLADSVLSGGIRRSALSTLFDANSTKMRTAKIGDWFIENPHFARSNNSIMIIRNTDNYDEFSNNFEDAKDWGEPGFAFLKDIWSGFNPCFEIAMEPRLLVQGTQDTYEYGWLFCNLTTLSGKDITSEEMFYDMCKLLSFLGTIQTSYNKFPFLGRVTEELVNRDCLLGCSISGIMSNPKLFTNPEILKKGAQIVNETNQWVAELLGINPAIRTTCIKPKISIYWAFYQ